MASRGHQTVFRVYLEYPSLPGGIPQFLLNKEDVYIFHEFDYHFTGNSDDAIDLLCEKMGWKDDLLRLMEPFEKKKQEAALRQQSMQETFPSIVPTSSPLMGGYNIDLDGRPPFPSDSHYSTESNTDHPLADNMNNQNSESNV